MKAARYYGREDIRIEQVPEPAVRPGQIKVSLYVDNSNEVFAKSVP